MIEQEILRLPEIPEGTPETQLRAIRSYLYRLAEQLQYLLSTEKEERLRGQDALSQEAFRGIQQRFLESPQIAQQLMCLANRNLGDRYVDSEVMEAFLQRMLPELHRAVYDLARLEKEKPAAQSPKAQLTVAPSPGAVIREGERVIFSPFPQEKTGPLEQIASGHWQIP